MKSLKELVQVIGLIIGFTFSRIWDFGKDVMVEWKSQR